MPERLCTTTGVLTFKASFYLDSTDIIRTFDWAVGDDDDVVTQFLTCLWDNNCFLWVL